jgi:hypothetical protein
MPIRQRLTGGPCRVDPRRIRHRHIRVRGGAPGLPPAQRRLARDLDLLQSTPENLSTGVSSQPPR